MWTDCVKSLQSATTTETEVDALKALKQQLQPGSNTRTAWNDADESLEQEWLQRAAKASFEEDNPFPGKLPDNLFPCQKDLDRFTLYIFERRFGWSETVCNGKRVQVQRLGSVGMTSKHEGKYKMVLIDLLDEFIKWYLHQRLSTSVLKSLEHTVVQAANKPVVRNQTVVHIMDWLKKNIELLKDEQFELVKHVILLGLTDVWSAIRSACAARLSPVIDHFSIAQLESFFNDLVQICQKNDAHWQAQEGAVMGINSVIRRFHWVGVPSDDFYPSQLKTSTSPKADYFLKFGQEELKKMPEFISSKIQNVIFPLLSHPQLSIREYATKAFSSYHTRCDFKDALASFGHVITLLCKGTDVPPNRAGLGTNLPHLAVLNPDYKFLDAYAAEGLLGVCVFLIKHIPPGFLLPDWPLYFSTFSLYLMHQASTVRQATSTIFKFLVAKDSNNPVLLKLILEGLCSQWQPDMELLTAPCAVSGTRQPPSPHCKGLTDLRHGTTGKDDCPKGHRHSVTSLDDENEELLADCWEWREGRLLAYELILQFLIKNHWIYTFGPSNFNFPNYQPKIGGSVDECSMIYAKQENRDKNKNVKKTNSYGGSTLKHLLNSPRETSYAVTGSEMSNIPEGMIQMRDRKNSLDSSTNTSAKIPIQNVHGSHSESIVTTDSGSCLKRVRPTLKRTVTIDPASYQSQSIHTLVRHYSYYSKSRQTNRHVTTNSMSSKASSLLHLVKMVDADTPSDGPSTRDTKAKSPAHEVLRSCFYSSPLDNKSSDEVFDPAWLKQLELDKLSSILEKMLYQTVECLADSRWELRRMSMQVLPCLVEVIRWFNMKVLEDLWDKYLTERTTLLCYGACIAFKYSLSHAAKLMPLLNDPPVTWQNLEFCKREVSRITSTVQNQMDRCLACVMQLLQRRCLDRMSVISLEILMIANSHFSIGGTEESMQMQAISDFCHQLFVQAHGDDDLATSLTNHKTKLVLPSPNDGFLSFGHKTDHSVDSARHVEKYVLNEIHSIIPVFFKNNKTCLTVNMLPLLVWYLGKDFDDDHINRDIYDSVYILSTKLNESIKDGSRSHQQEVAKQCSTAMRQLAEIVAQKELELHKTRQALDVYLLLCPLLSNAHHLTSIFQSVYFRTNFITSPQSSRGSRSCDDNLAILSNDIPPSPVAGLPSDSESDSEDQALGASKDLILHESLTLNASNNSGSGPSGRLSALSNSTDGCVVSPGSQASDIGSDWDSWSDEEEDQTAASAIFTEFVKKLKECYISIGRISEFTSEVQRLGDKERRVIKSMLDSR